MFTGKVRLKTAPKKRKKFDKRFQETDVASESWRLLMELWILHGGLRNVEKILT
jgi:hypothetical protein